MNFQFSGQTGYYKGKVRDVYYIGEKLIILIASDRISAFDVILPRDIPHKGEVLNGIAAYMLNACKDICPNWLLEAPVPMASIGRNCTPVKIEMVVRGNLAGHAWRTYSSGKRYLCGAKLPEGLTENDFLPHPIITPSTKANKGHDEDISPIEIINKKICSRDDLDKMMAYSLALFERGKDIAQKRNLVLADTKYEFGKIGTEIYLMDEIHTPDSSRYFYAQDFEKKQSAGEKQQQLSKEFVREWLIENDFMGRPGDKIPLMTDEWIDEISKRYISIYQLLTGKMFARSNFTSEDMYYKINTSLMKISSVI